MKKRLLLVAVLATLMGVLFAPRADAAASLSYEEAKSLCGRWGGTMQMLSAKCEGAHNGPNQVSVASNCTKYGGTKEATEHSESCTWSALRPATNDVAKSICSAMGGNYTASEGKCYGDSRNSPKISSYCSRFDGSYTGDSYGQTCYWAALSTASSTERTVGNLTYDEAKVSCTRWLGSFDMLNRQCTAAQNANPTPKIQSNCTKYGGTVKSTDMQQICAWSTLRPATADTARALCTGMNGTYDAANGKCSAAASVSGSININNYCGKFGGSYTYQSGGNNGGTYSCEWAALATTYMASPSTGGGGGSGGGSGGSTNSGGGGSGGSGGSTTPGGGGTIADVNEGSCTSILPGSWCNGEGGITSIISLAVSILTGAVLVAGTIGIIFCGFTWMTARENEAQVAKAKKRMLEIVIGLVAWVLLALLANLFIPKPASEIQDDIRTSLVNNKEQKA